MRRARLLSSVGGGAFLFAFWAIALAAPSSATAQGPNSAPPFDLADGAVIDEGARLFRQTCTGYCHGKDGGASRAPKLRGQKLEQTYVYARITKGSPNGMPSFEGAISRENIWKLVAYILSLSDEKDK